MITATVAADSINPQGCRLTTFVVRFPRIILAEVNTHRVFSRNSASSRAIPFETMLKMVRTDPFIPIRFQKDHKGMQGVEYFEGAEHEQCVTDWLKARDAAVQAATSFVLPVTKQLRNRLLEPFMWHTAIISATDYENWFALRAHKDAEIHIEALAYRMLEAYNVSTPKSLAVGEWHIPFGENMDEERILAATKEQFGEYTPEWTKAFVEDNKRRIAIARCARVSFQNYEGKDDYAADIKLCDRLFGATPKHLSPTEHVARAENHREFVGNFCGFTQFRKTVSDENLKDPRVKSLQS